MNINTATALARKMLAKKETHSTQTKIIILNYGEEQPVNMEGVIIIKALPEVNMARQILNESDVSNGLE
jgi:hypothetical protein